MVELSLRREVRTPLSSDDDGDPRDGDDDADKKEQDDDDDDEEDEEDGGGGEYPTLELANRLTHPTPHPHKNFPTNRDDDDEEDDEEEEGVREGRGGSRRRIAHGVDVGEILKCITRCK